MSTTAFETITIDHLASVSGGEDGQPTGINPIPHTCNTGNWFRDFLCRLGHRNENGPPRSPPG